MVVRRAPGQPGPNAASVRRCQAGIRSVHWVLVPSTEPLQVGAVRATGVPTVPRYDYRCEAGHKYERQEPFRSPVEHPCDRCGKTARRLLVAPPLIFKSGGFYKTSSRSGSRSSESSEAAADASKGKSKTSDEKNAADTSVSSPSQSHPSPPPAEG